MGDHDDSVHADALDRRNLLKKTAAGAAAVGIVWSAPRVEGLTLRPNYAAALSHTAFSVPLSLNPSSPSSSGIIDCGTGKMTFFAFASAGQMDGEWFPSGTASAVNVDVIGAWNAPAVNLSNRTFSATGMGLPAAVTLHFNCT